MQVRNGGAYRSRHEDLCELCSKPARHTCIRCHRRVCDMHYDPLRKICKVCAGGSVGLGGAKTPAGGQQIPETTCAVCNKLATHVCKNCKRSVCDDHFSKQEDICVMCSIRKKREEMMKS
ncbi:MAG: hypothetical protein LVQ97_02810 [Candidatus Micrarchaeales archaeon]|nr:hypothetical protein [Candidatus Micrarchaeales archaeon]